MQIEHWTAHLKFELLELFSLVINFMLPHIFQPSWLHFHTGFILKTARQSLLTEADEMLLQFMKRKYKSPLLLYLMTVVTLKCSMSTINKLTNVFPFHSSKTDWAQKHSKVHPFRCSTNFN